MTGNELRHHVDLAADVPPAQSFSIDGYAWPHYNQDAIGICTAIDLADMMQAAWGIPFSAQFIYNVGKKMYDGNTDEGSSIKTMLRVVNNYGAAPKSMVPTDDPTQDYQAYVDAWFAPEVFAAAKQYLMNYATARLDPVGFASDLSTSKYGLMTRMDTGTEWYTDIHGNISYKDSDIDPLRAPNPATGGHSVKCTAYFGLNQGQVRRLRNTWGDAQNPIMPGNLTWGNNGDISYLYSTLQPYVTEAWSISKPVIQAGYVFRKELGIGTTDPDVIHLQAYLNNHGFPVASSGAGSPGNETSFFGGLTLSAVKRFQAFHGIPATGYIGKLSLAILNQQ